MRQPHLYYFKELSKPEILDNIVNNLFEVQEKQLVKNGVIPLLMQDKKQVDKATENILKAIEQGVITETTAKRLKELEAKQKEIEAKILIEKSKSIMRLLSVIHPTPVSFGLSNLPNFCTE